MSLAIDLPLAFDPTTLPARIEQRRAEALAAGALRPIPTRSERIVDGGIDFLVRVIDTLERKAFEHRAGEARGRGDGAAGDPFLPCEPALFICDLTATHLCLFNKFNVVDRHLLAVTRRFEAQQALLDHADFTAAWALLAALGGLVFYNGGEVAGASQHHKHLQQVPLPLTDTGPPLPFTPLLEARPDPDGRLPGLPFEHRFHRFHATECDALGNAAASSVAHYRRLMRSLGLADRAPRQLGPYNLLLSRDWLLLVPRRAERCDGISLNALAYVGALLVKDRDQLAQLRRRGPFAALLATAAPRDAAAAGSRGPH